MLKKDYTAKLLSLEDVIITKVENISEEVHVYLELPRTKHRCPACGALTDRVHDYRMQIIKDIPLGRTTLLHLRKRRYRCDCGKRFFEKNTFLPKYYRSTSRLVAEIITAFRETVSASKIGTQFNVSGATAMRYFKCVSFKPTRLPKDSVLPYIKIVPERFAPTRPNYLCFVSTPTIDIEPNLCVTMRFCWVLWCCVPRLGIDFVPRVQKGAIWC